MKHTKPTKRELEEEKIAIERQAKVLYGGTPTSEFNGYMHRVREERRLNWAENEDLADEIQKYNQKKPNKKEPNSINTALPVVLTALAGAAIGNALVTSGTVEPSFMASDMNDVLGFTSASMAAGGIVGLINSIAYCTKPITRFIYDRQIAKRQSKLDANNRRNNAITYLEECLKKEESAHLAEFTDTTLDEAEGIPARRTEIPGQTEIDLDEIHIGHA